MKINKLSTGIIIVKEEGEIFDLTDWLDEIYEQEEIELPSDKEQEYFDEFNKNGSVTIPNETKTTEVKKQEDRLDTLSIDDSLDELDKELEDLEEDECIKIDINIGELIAKYFDKEWRIQSAKVFRQYASEYMEVNFKRDGKPIKSRWYTGPKINLLSKIADEIKPSQSGMDGRPVLDYIEELESKTLKLFIRTSEDINVVYTMITRQQFAVMKKKAIFG